MSYFPGYHGWVLHWVSGTKVGNVFINCYFNTHFAFFDEANEIIVSQLNHLFYILIAIRGNFYLSLQNACCNWFQTPPCSLFITYEAGKACRTSRIKKT